MISSDGESPFLSGTETSSVQCRSDVSAVLQPLCRSLLHFLPFACKAKRVTDVPRGNPCAVSFLHIIYPIPAHYVSCTCWCCAGWFLVSSFSLDDRAGCSTEKRDLGMPAVVPVHRESWFALALFTGRGLRVFIKEPTPVLCSLFSSGTNLLQSTAAPPATCPDTITDPSSGGINAPCSYVAGAVPVSEWWKAELSLPKGRWKCPQHVTSSRLVWEILKLTFWIFLSWYQLFWTSDKMQNLVLSCFRRRLALVFWSSKCARADSLKRGFNSEAALGIRLCIQWSSVIFKVCITVKQHPFFSFPLLKVNR